MTLESGIALDDVVHVNLDSSSINGGLGYDTIDFGSLEARFASSWNNMTESGGAFEVSSPETGETSRIYFSNIERLIGSSSNDVLIGNAKMLDIEGGRGADFISAGMDTPLPMHLYGGEGSDTIEGSDLGDKINGNQGADTLHGWDGNDRVWGGQDGDLVSGDGGHDEVNGNKGNDTVSGGAGNDTIRGGRDDDALSGDEGDDRIFGDGGSDTLTGGEGADIFYTSADGGADIVTDFDSAAGDRIILAPGSAYTVAQVGTDIHISITGGSELTLEKVELTSLPPDWISAA